MRSVTLVAMAVAAGCGSSPRAPSPSAAPAHDDVPRARARLDARWVAAQRASTVAPGACATDAPDLEKTCHADAECSVVQEVLDECHSTAHLGVNARGRAAFAARPAFEPCAGGRCPMCNVEWHFAEDCAELDHDAVAVECVRGRCQTRVPAR